MLAAYMGLDIVIRASDGSDCVAEARELLAAGMYVR
jgi:hypothetical protein